MTIYEANTALPRVDSVTSVPEKTEGSASPGQFTVSRTGSTAAALTVFFSIDTTPGNATNGTDYANIGNTVINIMKYVIIPKKINFHREINGCSF